MLALAYGAGMIALSWLFMEPILSGMRELGAGHVPIAMRRARQTAAEPFAHYSPDAWCADGGLCVDFILSWANVSEPSYAAERHVSAVRQRARHVAFDESSPFDGDADAELLLLSLDSLARHAPWARRFVLLVPDARHIPSGLQQRQAALTVLHFEDLMLDAERTQLHGLDAQPAMPVFSINSLLMRLHRLPDLAPWAVLVPPGFVALRPLAPDDLFVMRNASDADAPCAAARATYAACRHIAGTRVYLEPHQSLTQARASAAELNVDWQSVLHTDSLLSALDAGEGGDARLAALARHRSAVGRTHRYYANAVTPLGVARELWAELAADVGPLGSAVRATALARFHTVESVHFRYAYCYHALLRAARRAVDAMHVLGWLLPSGAAWAHASAAWRMQALLPHDRALVAGYLSGREADALASLGDVGALGTRLGATLMLAASEWEDALARVALETDGQVLRLAARAWPNNVTMARELAPMLAPGRAPRGVLIDAPTPGDARRLHRTLLEHVRGACAPANASAVGAHVQRNDGVV